MEFTIFASNKPHYTPSPGKECKYAGQSVRVLPIRILTVGKKRSAGVQLIVDEYIEKLKLYCPVEDVRIKSNPKNARDVMAQIEHEDMAVMGLIKSNEWVVMLDEHGLDVGSEQMASLIGDAGNTGASSILFCIGGPYGHGRQLRERADVSIRLSSLVLNHEIALVVLVEQLYRLERESIKLHHPPLGLGLFSKARSIIIRYYSKYPSSCVKKRSPIKQLSLVVLTTKGDQKVLLPQFLMQVFGLLVGTALLIFLTFAFLSISYQPISIHPRMECMKHENGTRKA